MPVEPNNGTLLVDLSSEAGVAELVEYAEILDPERVRTFLTEDWRIASDIGDHLLYLSAVHPEWFAPYRELAVTELYERLPMNLEVAAVLLPGIDGAVLGPLCDQVRADPKDRSAMELLAGTADPEALEVVADAVRAGGSTRDAGASGIHVGATGPASWRFTASRAAIHVPAQPHHGEPDGIVGLPLCEVADDPEGVITWHYLSAPPTLVAGTPRWPHDLVHLLSPRTYWYELYSEVGPDGRCHHPVADDGGEPFDVHLADIEADPPPPVGVAIRAYDGELVYRNGHILSSAGVVGSMGGPPVGLYPNPACPGCGVLMFHVATVEHGIREYGDGFRSVFICETCERTCSTGTGWN